MKSETTIINLPGIITEKTFFKDTELDSPLPEFNPDISRLIKVDATPIIHSIECEDGVCEVRGNITFGMLYETDYKNKIAYTAVDTDITQKIELKSSYSSIYPDANIKCLFLTCKLLGPRRFVIKAKIQIDFKAVATNDEEAVDINTADINVFYKTEDITMYKPFDRLEEEFRFRETAVTEKPIGSIITSNGSLSYPEIQNNNGSYNVKTVLTVKTLYEVEDTDNEYVHSINTFPLVMNLDTPDNIDENDMNVSLELLNLSTVSDLDEYGENRILNFDATVKMKTTFYEEVTASIAVDGFSGKNDYESDIAEISFDTLNNKNNKTFILEKNFTTDKIHIDEILDTSCNFNITDKSIEDNILTIKGMVTYDVLTRSENSIANQTFTSDFEETIPLDDIDLKLMSIHIFPFETTSSLYGSENISIRTMCLIKPIAFANHQALYMKSFDIFDECRNDNKRICFYYPENSENLWDIAKKYHQNPKRLKDNNKDAFDENGNIKKNLKYLAIKS
ncbi:DUF3794 domain-containing protein [Eubacteriales bacterium OttesenSCG-928-G02]|nr:DUF3794 domain-containing protein [Eubacteriales bacterium OttesenSCG-928-G02]